jgi:hypothetical protein
MGGGFYPTTELADLGGEKGHESIGSLRVVNRTIGVRILSRSNTLKLRAHFGLSEGAFGGLSMNRLLSSRTLYTCLAGVCPTALQGAEVVRHPGKQNDVGHDPVGWCRGRTGCPDELCTPNTSQVLPDRSSEAEVVRHPGNQNDVGHDPVGWCRGRQVVQPDLCINTSQVLSDRSSGCRSGSPRKQTE